VWGATVSPEFFDLLGAPARGRAFGAREERSRVAVISHALWLRRFGGDPGVLGRTVRLSGEPYVVIGVTAPAFEFPDASFELWVPIGAALETAPGQAEDRSLRIFRAIGRLRPGATPEQARAEAATLSNRLARDFPDTNAGFEFELESVPRRLLGDARPALLALLAAVGLVLAIACANVANLLLARASARTRELAIRAALGASRGRIVRQLLTESLVLASLGGAGGVLLASWLTRLVPQFQAVDIPRLGQVSLDGHVLLFALVVSLATGVLFGLAPAFQSVPARLAGAFEAGGRGSSGDGASSRLRAGLLVGEVGLAFVVVVGAGLLVQSLVRLLHQDPGFEPKGLVAANLELFHIDDPAMRTAALERILGDVSQTPGIEAVGAGTGLPPQTAQRATGFELEGRQPEPDGLAGYFLGVTPGYFRALGTRVIRGRAFTNRDSESAAPVVVVNRELARRLFPNEDPVGRRLRLVGSEQSPVWRTIVGVVEDVRYSGLDDPTESAIYTPFAQTPFLWSYLMVRTSLPERSVAGALRAAVSEVDPRLVPARVEPVADLISASVAGRRLQTRLLTSFGILALLLAGVGIYGVAAYAVGRRRREIGVRMALGARRGDVLRLVVGQHLRLALFGVGLGLAGALAFGRALRGLLYGVGAADPTTMAGVAALLAAVAAAAAYLPARRAADLDPATALRSE
jgi:putative ABC transport system permease protein